MINNWEHHNLQMAFDNIVCLNGRPSDIDMFYITNDKFSIIGELKNGDYGTFKSKQKELLQTFIDNYKYGGIIVYGTHHNTIEQGDTYVDVSKCKVEELYYKKKWYKPKGYTIQDIFNRYDKEEKMNIIEEKEKTIYRNERDGKIAYSIGIAKKKEDGTFENGYIPCRFKKDVELENKTKIKIKNAWLDFYKVEKKTFIYVFINEFEKVENKQEEKAVDNWGSPKDIEPDDLPFYG